MTRGEFTKTGGEFSKTEGKRSGYLYYPFYVVYP